MISINGLGKSFGDRTLFGGVSLHLSEGRRYGLVGANGSGKTTFLKILAGETAPSAGEVSIPKRARVGVLSQDRFRYEDTPIMDVVLMGRPELWRAIEVKEEVLAASAGDGSGFDTERFAAAEETIQRLDGYAMEARAGAILEGLGIPNEVHRRPLSALSGGFKLRVLLAQALAADPDVLLLDEPTNHLDIVSIRWLEKFLADFDGCVVAISHDHRFLDNVATDILDIDYETITRYPGGYTDFVDAKVAERERREAEIDKREKEIADHMAFVDRFRAKATKARQAQSRLKQVARIEIEPLPKSSRRRPTFRFEPARASGRVAVSARGIDRSFGDRRVLADVSLEVRRGDRLAVIGPNGIGKSTLLKILVGRLEPDAGEVEWGHEVRPGWFAQDHREQLSGGGTALEWLWSACPGEGRGFLMAQLGMVLLSGDEAEKSVDKLSGGEAARLLFARLAVEKPNVLVLDEPTNHLDLEGVEALADALEAYEGTVIFVSHDRWFVERLATRIFEIAPEGVRDFVGGYRAFVDWCGDDHLDRATASKAPSREPGAPGGKRGRPAAGEAPRPKSGADRAREREARARRVELAGRRDGLVDEIATAETRLEEVRARFADPALYADTDPEELRVLKEEERAATGRVEALLAEWEAVERRLAEEEAAAEERAETTGDRAGGALPTDGP